jgi:hypothetical protein
VTLRSLIKENDVSSAKGTVLLVVVHDTIVITLLEITVTEYVDRVLQALDGSSTNSAGRWLCQQ